jgi:hypothetical protein
MREIFRKHSSGWSTTQEMSEKAAIILVASCMFVVLLAACASDGAPGEAPSIVDIRPASGTRVDPGAEVHISCIAEDPDGGPLEYEWSASGGWFAHEDSAAVLWVAPDEEGRWDISVTVTNEEGLTAERGLRLSTQPGEEPPRITEITITPDPYEEGDICTEEYVTLSCVGQDPDGGPVFYDWFCGKEGEVTGGGKNHITWRTPEKAGSYAITVSVQDDEGDMEQRTIHLDIAENLDPYIENVRVGTEEGEDVVLRRDKLGESVRLIGGASDDNGHPLEYVWVCNAGKLHGQGKDVEWTPPLKQDEALITLTVEDGHGGFDVQEVKVTMEDVTTLKTFTPLRMETGTLCSSGEVTTESSRAGDSKEDEGYRALWSFDLYELRGLEVEKATVEFETKDIVWDPFDMPVGLRGLQIWQVRGPHGELPDYDADIVRELTTTVLWEPPQSFDVTGEVAKVAEGVAGDDRLQLMAGFQRRTNNNCLAEYVSWGKVLLQVWYYED